ncbi:hypothetical protein WOLCODRAFT_166044 [Wolfiporia cocos MD-104 SS10]|uniref:Uncharacterized protein n=1 Tax=Wolfiporia cocos (strain MD-104) TaxID=742152 RepID=A0A2H3JEI0_WOLCO|nr:hypothetical protein WOLCODRAFT_166044 [Wolfiporia cocos MD-104 SS10]
MASSSSVASTASSSSSAPSASSSSDTNASFGQTGTLPFSFLITFCAVFIFFVGCGFSSRRLTAELRRNLGRTIQQQQSRPRAPRLWDVVPHAEFGRAVDMWAGMLPLSATYIREKEEEPTPSPPLPSISRWSSVPVPPTQQIPQRSLVIRILDYIPIVSLLLAVREMRRRQALLGPNAPCADVPPKPPVRAVQVAVLISMPSADRPVWRRPRSTLDPYIDTRQEVTDVEKKKDRGKGRDECFTSYMERDLGMGYRELAVGLTELPWTTDDLENTDPSNLELRPSSKKALDNANWAKYRTKYDMTPTMWFPSTSLFIVVLLCMHSALALPLFLRHDLSLRSPQKTLTKRDNLTALLSELNFGASGDSIVRRSSGGEPGLFARDIAAPAASTASEGSAEPEPDAPEPNSERRGFGGFRLGGGLGSFESLRFGMGDSRTD